MPNENMIMATKLHPSNNLHNSNQAKLTQRINELAYLILVLITVSINDGSC